MADVHMKRCVACNTIHRDRETCPKCAERKRREVREQAERERREKQTPMPMGPTASLDWADRMGRR